MCKCDILHSDENGYVAYCENCHRFQLAFDVFSANFYIKEFEKLCNIINGVLSSADGTIDPDSKLFVFRLDTSSIRFHFSLNDFERLNALLEPAKIMYQVFELTHE